MNITLHMRPSKSAQRQACAWWLAGGTATEWLSEIVQWPTNQELLTFIPLEDANKACAGVVVLVPSEDAAAVESFSPRAVGYGRIGDRLLLPVDACLEPEACIDEITSLLPDDQATYIWQPCRGLTRYEPETNCRVVDLLSLPAQSSDSWQAAMSGTKLNHRLVSITPEITINANAMMQAAGGDIGTQSDLIRHLPRSPKERRAWRRIVVGMVCVVVACVGILLLASFLPHRTLDWTRLLLVLGAAIVACVALFALGRWLLNRQKSSQPRRRAETNDVSESAGGRAGSWFRKAGQWVGSQLSKIDDWVIARRNREVERLLHMLDVNPDEGLRYALPFYNQASYRGIGPGGALLVERSIDFNLSKLGGGGPVDLWCIKADHQEQLIQRYRELANREIMLGRHRRTAYIFAELLQDFHAAAAALRDGGHFREAAALYDQKLGDSKAAANCLEQGGLLAEAIVMYHRRGDHEKVGDLHERLGQTELAQAAFERAASIRLKQHDYLGAAHLHEMKLQQPERALATLLSGWPATNQAVRCLDESFNLLQRQSAHERAEKQLQKLCDEFRELPHAKMLVRSVTRLANHYPNASVRRLAEDQTLVLTSRLLHYSDAVAGGDLLQEIANLIPRDRLFARDCARFGNRHVPKLRSRRSEAEVLRIVNEFSLTRDNWKSVIAVGDEFYAAGFRGNEVVLVRGSWDGSLHQPAGRPWQVPAKCTEHIMMAAYGPTKVLIQPLHAPPVPTDRDFPKTDWFGYRAVGGHPALDQFVIGMSVNHSGTLTTIRAAAEGLILAMHRMMSGTLLQTRRLDSSLFSGEPALPLVMAEFGQTYVISAGARFMSIDGRLSHSVSTPSRIRSLETFRTNYLALLEQGAYAWFGKPLQVTGISFADELENPVGCFLSNDLVMLADSDQIQLYRHRLEGLCLIASIQRPQATPIACIAIRDRQQAVLCAGDGRVTVLSVQS